MLGIILIILVVRMFTRKAGEKGFNKVLWGFIGALSYYGPVILMQILVIPYLGESGMVQFDTEGKAYLFVIVTSIGAGVIGCVTAYQILKRMEPARMADQVIDNNIN